MEVGQTGTVFVPGKPFELGEFMACKILEVHGEKLRVELENGATGIIEKTEFTPRYMVIPSNAGGNATERSEGTRCERCKGTGYANVARDSGMEDLPMLLQPIGVFRCTNCCGSGRVGISDEAMELLRNAIKQWRAKPSNA